MEGNKDVGMALNSLEGYMGSQWPTSPKELTHS